MKCIWKKCLHPETTTFSFSIPSPHLFHSCLAIDVDGKDTTSVTVASATAHTNVAAFGQGAEAFCPVSHRLPACLRTSKSKPHVRQVVNGVCRSGLCCNFRLHWPSLGKMSLTLWGTLTAIFKKWCINA